MDITQNSPETIALAVIADEYAIEDGFERMVDSVKDQVDAVYVAYTGDSQHVQSLIFQILRGKEWLKNYTVAEIEWKDDFSFARNASFALVDAANEQRASGGLKPFDWIVWLDCDDVWNDNLRWMTSHLRSLKAHGGLVNYHYQLDENGDASVSHYKPRIFRADYRWNWSSPIHENCDGPMGTRMHQFDGDYHVDHHRGDTRVKSQRNKEMISAWFKEKGSEDPRAVMFMGHQTLSMAEQAPEPDRTALMKTALRLYQQFMRMNPSSEDSYVVNGLCSDILRVMGRYEDSINIDLQGIKMKPEWPGSYVSIANTHFDAGSYEDAIVWAKKARELLPVDGQLQIHDHKESKYKPWMITGAARMKLGDYSGAFIAFHKAKEYHDDDFTRERIQEARQQIKKEEKAPEQKTPKYLHELRWGNQEDKSIAFFVPPTAEPWNPDLLVSKGMGGTETSVIKLAEHMATRGWRVVVFGTPDDWDGRIVKHGAGTVEWYSAHLFHPDEPFTVFVGLRAPQIFDTPVNATQKVLWLHDISMGPSRHGEFGDRFSMVDSIVYPSTWHAGHIMKVYDYKDQPWKASNHGILNGIDRKVFLVDPEEDQDLADLGFHNPRDPKSVIYASSPDRGLTRLLELWPDIAAEEPDASLHIYYGWDSIDAIVASGHPTGPQLAHFKKVTQEKIEKLNKSGYKIYEMGRVDQDTLAVALKQAGVMAYPANFMETFGIVFAQALAAGVQLVTCDMGALPYMTRHMYSGENLHRVVPGPPDSMEFGPRFVDAVVDVIRNTTDEMRDVLPDCTMNMDWKTVAAGWDLMIDNHFQKLATEAAAKVKGEHAGEVRQQQIIEASINHQEFAERNAQRSQQLLDEAKGQQS